jgi:hypothetical protein
VPSAGLIAVNFTSIEICRKVEDESECEEARELREGARVPRRCVEVFGGKLSVNYRDDIIGS